MPIRMRVLPQAMIGPVLNTCASAATGVLILRNESAETPVQW